MSFGDKNDPLTRLVVSFLLAIVIFLLIFHFTRAWADQIDKIVLKRTVEREEVKKMNAQYQSDRSDRSRRYLLKSAPSTKFTWQGV